MPSGFLVSCFPDPCLLVPARLSVFCAALEQYDGRVLRNGAMISGSFSIVIFQPFVLIVTGFGLFVLQCQRSRVNASCSSTITARALIVT